MENTGKNRPVFALVITTSALEFPEKNRYNIITKYISDKAWRGRKCIDPESLSEQDADFSVNVFTKEFQKTLNRTRDVIKMSSENACYQILAIENQQAIHYAMPLRCMIYDGLVYLNQVTDLTARNREMGSLKRSEEFLSGLKKTDRLIPCCTIVLYYGEKEWEKREK